MLRIMLYSLLPCFRLLIGWDYVGCPLVFWYHSLHDPLTVDTVSSGDLRCSSRCRLVQRLSHLPLKVLVLLSSLVTPFMWSSLCIGLTLYLVCYGNHDYTPSGIGYLGWIRIAASVGRSLQVSIFIFQSCYSWWFLFIVLYVWQQSLSHMDLLWDRLDSCCCSTFMFLLVC